MSSLLFVNYCRRLDYQSAAEEGQTSPPECARNPGAVTDEGNLSVCLRSGRSRLEIGRICDKLKIGRICWVCDKVTNALVSLPTASRLISRLSLVSRRDHHSPRKNILSGRCIAALELLHNLCSILSSILAVFIPRLPYQKPGLG